MNSINYDGWELKFFDEATKFRKYQFSLIVDHLKGNAGEIGPGNGIFLENYKTLVENIDLFEPSINFLNGLKEKKIANAKIYNSHFIEKPLFYDTLLYLDVLEHIEEDYNELKKAYKSLKKGGKLIVNVPAYQILFSNFDRDVNHYRRYNKKYFSNLIKSFEFSQIDMKYYDSLGFILSLCSKIFEQDYRKNFKVKIKIWDKLIPFSKILDLITLYSFGKSLLVVCTK